MTDEAKDFITDHGYDPVYGARPLKRYVQKHVETLAARIILQGDVSSGDTIVITVENDRLTALVQQKEVYMLPNQPMILLSFINTKLRDDYSSLDELCDDFHVPKDEIEEKLASIDYEYDEGLNKFV